MEGFDFLHEHVWRPFAPLGFTHSFFTLDATVTIFTWIVLGLLILFSFFCWYVLKKPQSMARHLIIQFVDAFVDMNIQTMGTFRENHFYFITALFIFILLCNCITVLPWTEEPTQNINTTIALALISFTYIQYHTIKAHGIMGYLKEYITPVFVMFPLHIISKISSIISLSFRLFGNIFGGAIISKIYFTLISGTLLYEIFGLFSGLNLIITLFFGVFEGMLQAFVFSMLSLTYLSIAITGDEPTGGDLP